jgi:hypothetical protein
MKLCSQGISAAQLRSNFAISRGRKNNKTETFLAFWLFSTFFFIERWKVLFFNICEFSGRVFTKGTRQYLSLSGRHHFETIVVARQTLFLCILVKEKLLVFK